MECVEPRALAADGGGEHQWQPWRQEVGSQAPPVMGKQAAKKAKRKLRRDAANGRVASVAADQETTPLGVGVGGDCEDVGRCVAVKTTACLRGFDPVGNGGSLECALVKHEVLLA